MLICCIINSYWEDQPLFPKFFEIILFLKVSSTKWPLAQTDWLEFLFTVFLQESKDKQYAVSCLDTFCQSSSSINAAFTNTDTKHIIVIRKQNYLFDKKKLGNIISQQAKKEDIFSGKLRENINECLATKKKRAQTMA